MPRNAANLPCYAVRITACNSRPVRRNTDLVLSYLATGKLLKSAKSTENAMAQDAAQNMAEAALDSAEAAAELARQPRGSAGRFASHYSERRGDAIALRLPLSLDRGLRQQVGWQTKADNPQLKSWIEAAIAEKLSREQAADWR